MRERGVTWVTILTYLNIKPLFAHIGHYYNQFFGSRTGGLIIKVLVYFVLDLIHVFKISGSY